MKNVTRRLGAVVRGPRPSADVAVMPLPLANGQHRLPALPPPLLRVAERPLSGAAGLSAGRVIRRA